MDCDFRLIRRTVFDAVKLRSDSGTICLELVKKLQDAGYRFVEVPVHHFHRAAGRSQFFNLSRLWRTGVQLLELWHELVWRGDAGRRLAPAPVPTARAQVPVAKVGASHDLR